MGPGLLSGIGQGLMSVGSAGLQNYFQEERDKRLHEYAKELRAEDRAHAKGLIEGERAYMDRVRAEDREHNRGLIEGERAYMDRVREETRAQQLEDIARSEEFQRTLQSDAQEFAITERDSNREFQMQRDFINWMREDLVRQDEQERLDNMPQSNIGRMIHDLENLSPENKEEFGDLLKRVIKGDAGSALTEKDLLDVAVKFSEAMAINTDVDDPAELLRMSYRTITSLLGGAPEPDDAGGEQPYRGNTPPPGYPEARRGFDGFWYVTENGRRMRIDM